MGDKFIDQYTYLHLATGIICYFWGIPLYHFIIINILYEIIENTKYGIYVINNYIKIACYNLII